MSVFEVTCPNCGRVSAFAPRSAAEVKKAWHCAGCDTVILEGDKPLKERHTCHAEGCKKTVPPKLFMCFLHWRQVPRPLQRAIWRHYRPGQELDKHPSGAYLDAARQAVAAVKSLEDARKTTGGTIKTQGDGS